MVVMSRAQAVRAEEGDSWLGPLATVDLYTLLYLAFATAVLISRWAMPFPRKDLFALGHVLIVVTVLLVARLRRVRPHAFLATWYPLPLLAFLYGELGFLNRAQGISHDATVQSWDAALFGGQPSYDWIRAMPSPALSAVLHVAYLSYYFIIVGAPLGLWLSGRREAAGRTILCIMTAFYVCYAVFLLFPVAGPRYVFPLAHNAATTIGPAAFTQNLLNAGSAWGTAFPSSHVAVAIAGSLSAAAAWPAFGLWLVVDACLLALGTVYGQFHYGVDALSGVAFGLAAFYVTRARRR